MAEGVLNVALAQRRPFALDLAFTCGPGDVLAVFGPSGSGKTTLLRLVAGLQPLASGHVRVGGHVWCDTRTGTHLPTHRRRLGYVSQDPALFPHLHAVDNVCLALGHLQASDRRDRAAALLGRVGLPPEALQRRPEALSGGERQRVAIARALARDPQALLLDEPFAAVDRVARRHLQDLLDEIRRDLSVPIVLVTHDFGDVVRLATHLLLIDAGRVVASGPLAAVTGRPDLPWLREAAGLGAVFGADVTARDESRGLATLAFDGGAILAPLRATPGQARVRVRIPARDVVIARAGAEGLSAHNTLAGVVSAVWAAPDDDCAVVRVEVGAVGVLAEVTRDTVARLAIAPGVHLHVLVKSLSLDVH